MHWRLSPVWGCASAVAGGHKRVHPGGGESNAPSTERCTPPPRPPPPQDSPACEPRPLIALAESPQGLLGAWKMYELTCDRKYLDMVQGTLRFVDT